MIFKTLAIFRALCAIAAAQDSEKRFQINGVFYEQQCGDQSDLIANPRICFSTNLDINKEAIKGLGRYDGYSTSDGHSKFVSSCRYSSFAQ